MEAGASWARAAASLRGTARNVMPAALTKHASVRPLVSASAARPNVNVRLSSSRAIRTFCNSAWKISHSLTKPLSGGSAAIAAAPNTKHAAVHGMRVISPPSTFMLRVPVAWTPRPLPGRAGS
jgi:hypothetical protein